jgi:hypothetical protein
MERIPAESWRTHAGHVKRYEWAATFVQEGDRVNDIACGVGYGSTLMPEGIDYHGYDRPGVPDLSFPGTFHAVDLDAPLWTPEVNADVALCFETLEHVKEPRELAWILEATTERTILISAPTVPTKHMNPHHLHDFTPADIPPLFPLFFAAEVWEQPEELSHVWRFERSDTTVKLVERR